MHVQDSPDESSIVISDGIKVHKLPLSRAADLARSILIAVAAARSNEEAKRQPIVIGARHTRVFHFIRNYKMHNDGNTPTSREIEIACRVSQRRVTRLLNELEAANLIQRIDSRRVRIVGGHYSVRPQMTHKRHDRVML